MHTSSLGLVYLTSLFFVCCDAPKLPHASNPKVTQDSLLTDSQLRSISDSLYHLGNFHLNKENKDSALYYLAESLNYKKKLTPDSMLVMNYLTIADLYLDDFKYAVADKYLQPTRLIMDSLVLNPSLSVEILFLSAECSENMLDHASTQSFLNRTLKIIQQYFPNDTDKLARVYFSLASNYYFIHDFNRAIDYYKQLVLLTPMNYEREGEAYTYIGVSLREMKNYQASLTYFDKAIAANLKWAGPDSDPLAKIYLQKAFALDALGEVDSADYYLKRNLSIRRRVYGEKNVNTFGAKFSLGESNFSRGQYDTAVRYYHESLISLIKGFNDHNLYTNPNPDQTEWNIDLIIGAVGKAKALVKLASQDSTRSDLFTLALSTYQLSDSVFTRYRSELLYDDPQLQQISEGRIPYNEIVDLSFRLYDLEKDERYVEVALNTMERSRAVVLQNSLNKVASYTSTGISTDYRGKENKLKRQRATIIQALAKHADQKAIDSLNESLLILNAAFEKYQIELQQVVPGYFATKFNVPDLKLSQVQAFLSKNNSVLLEYMIADRRIFLIGIGKDSFRIIRIERNKLDSAMQIFMHELADGTDNLIELDKYQRFSLSANQLYNQLIKPVSSLLQKQKSLNLIISADGQLATLPFEAFITQPPSLTEVNYRLPYMNSDYPISYSYSLSMLMRQTEIERKGRKLLALGFAGEGSSRQSRDAMASLPGTEEEINAISEVMKNDVNKYLLEADATESAFKKLVSDFDIAHLAIHGVADTTNALDSKLIFREETDGSDEDGRLYAYELYDLDLKKLDLAILSACESGVGKLQQGEGVMSIARGFAYAGCPSMIMSLWKINDHTSANIMSSFYKNLAQDKRLDMALANAKQDYIKNANEFNSHPHYWAAFLQVGDPRSLDVDDGFTLTFYGILLIMTFAIVLILLLTPKLISKYRTNLLIMKARDPSVF